MLCSPGLKEKPDSAMEEAVRASAMKRRTTGDVKFCFLSKTATAYLQHICHPFDNLWPQKGHWREALGMATGGTLDPPCNFFQTARLS